MKLFAILFAGVLVVCCGLDIQRSLQMHRIMQEHFSLNENGFSMAAFGDSITAAFDAEHIGPNRSYSWATGEHVDSVLSKLKKLKPDQCVEGINVSISRATSSFVLKEVLLLTYEKIDYATIIVGSNDLCLSKVNDDEGMNQFEANVDNILTRLISDHKGIKIDLGAIPNIPHLYDIGVPSEHCRKRWEIVRAFCPPIFKKDVTQNDLSFFKFRWIMANDVLENLAAKYVSNVRFIKRLEDPDFTIEHISQIDCFHPNPKGQEFIANVFWQMGWNSN